MENNDLEENILETNKRIRGLMRKAHFEEGGRLDEWRGQHNVEIDKKKESSRKFCRRQNHRDDE